MSVVRRSTNFTELESSAALLDGFIHGFHNLDIKRFVKNMQDIIAQGTYNLEPFIDLQHENYAISEEGRIVLIKATFAGRILLQREPPHLIVVQIKPNGALNEVFNGPGELAWNAASKGKEKRLITTSSLRKLMSTVPSSERIPKHEG
jgi:hypothetical protein